MAAPVSKGDELELRIDSLAYGGNGVARHNGFVLFVRRALPGDLVRARVTKVRRGYAEAIAADVLEPSSARVDAPPRPPGTCGRRPLPDLPHAREVPPYGGQVPDAPVRPGGPG